MKRIYRYKINCRYVMKFGLLIIVLQIFSCSKEITPYETDLIAEIPLVEGMNSAVEGTYYGSSTISLNMGSFVTDTTFADTIRVNLIQPDSILFTIRYGRQFQFKIDSSNIYDQIFQDGFQNLFSLMMPDSLEVVHWLNGEGVTRTDIFNGKKF